MFYNAKNGIIYTDDSCMDYVSFGTGHKKLIIIPGLGEGLRSMKGLALPMAYMYRIFAKDFRVYIFGSRRTMPQGYTTEDMAADLKNAADILGIHKADILGVSQGGMIAQHFAADYPDRVEKLVLAVTTAKADENVINAVTPWIEMAKQGRYRDLMTDNFRKMYTEDYLRRNRFMLPFATRFGAPESYDKFIVMANACLSHDGEEKLTKITAPTFVIGGEKDKITGSDASRIVSDKIKNSRLFMYPQYGHSLYDEAKDFNQKVYNFLQN